MARIRSEHGSEDQSDVRVVGLPTHWKPTIHEQFHGPDDILRRAKQKGCTWTKSRVSRTRDAKLGTETWDEAVNLAEHGWAEGLRHLVRQTGLQAQHVSAPARGWQYDYAGAHPDVPRFLGGDLDCMIDYQPDYIRFRPIVRMVVSPVTYSDVSDASIRNWGAALVSWIDELERFGRRVEVIWMSCSRPTWIDDAEEKSNTGGPRVAISFCLKEADQPVELDRLAFWLMHPAAQRRIQFAIKEQMFVERWYHTNYGAPIADVAFMREVYGKDAMYFPIENGAATVEIGLNAMKRLAGDYLEPTQNGTVAA
jgi:hypothetical protein